MEEKIYHLALVRAKGLGRIRREALINAFGSAEKIFNDAGLKEISFAAGLTREEASEIFKNKNQLIDSARREIEKASRLGAEIFFPYEKGYPPPLNEIRDKPEALYIKGEYLESDFFSVAVVGSRRATGYGLAAAKYLVEELARSGITSVSGLAEGIDTAAHTASIESGARTIAVLGNGIGVCYPFKNKKLMDKISCGAGAVLSEYPPDMMPTPATFPYRNRIISALALGVLVVEADEKSGALITARHALEQGKDVFAVPGGIFSKLSRGTHALIKMGAKLVETPEDIIEELSELAAWVSRSRAKNNLSAGGLSAADGEKPEIHSGISLNTEDKMIIETIASQGGSPVSLDFIAARTGIHAGVLSGRLLELELNGTVRSLPGSCYSVVAGFTGR